MSIKDEIIAALDRVPAEKLPAIRDLVTEAGTPADAIPHTPRSLRGSWKLAPGDQFDLEEALREIRPGWQERLLEQLADDPAKRA